jgi:hypothetical protein
LLQRKLRVQERGKQVDNCNGTRKKDPLHPQEQNNTESKKRNFVPSDDEIITYALTIAKHYQKLMDIDGLGMAMQAGPDSICSQRDSYKIKK